MRHALKRREDLNSVKARADAAKRRNRQQTQTRTEEQHEAVVVDESPIALKQIIDAAVKQACEAMTTAFKQGESNTTRQVAELIEPATSNSTLPEPIVQDTQMRPLPPPLNSVSQTSSTQIQNTDINALVAAALKAAADAPPLSPHRTASEKCL